MIEIFVDIKGYEGLYQISNFGRVKSLARNVRTGRGGIGIRSIKEKILTPAKKENDYFFVSIGKNNVHKCHYIHRLVAQHFIPNPENKPEVNHTKSNKSDNRYFRLEWSTKSENLLHSFKHGTHKPLIGSKSPRAKLNDEKVYAIKERYNDGGVSIRKLANEFGVHHAIIYGIIKGKRWPHVILKTA